jgi:hypothetical protein
VIIAPRTQPSQSADPARLVDLTAWKIHALTQPGDGGYAQERTADLSATVTISGLELHVSDLLGPQPPA